MPWRSELEDALQSVPDDQVPEALGELERQAALLWVRVHQQNGRPERPEPDTYLTAEQVADRVGLSRKWVYAHRDQLGGRKLGGALRFPTRALDRWLAAKQ